MSSIAVTGYTTVYYCASYVCCVFSKYILCWAGMLNNLAVAVCIYHALCATRSLFVSGEQPGCGIPYLFTVIQWYLLVNYIYFSVL